MCLPPELLERILVLLPLPDLLRFRTVSKRWLALTSSPEFARFRSSLSAQTQLLLLCSTTPELACFAFDFQSSLWHKLPLDFLPGGYSPFSPASSGTADASFKGSAGGLLVVDVPHRPGLPCSRVSTYLCNPLTRSSATVPKSPTVHFTQARGFVVDEDASSYKVVVAGSPMDDFSYKCKVFIHGVTRDCPMTEVFDSSSNSWSTTGSLPPGYHVSDEFMTLRDGSLYCTASYPNALMIYNLQQGTWTEVGMPRQDKSLRYTLMNCNGRLLIAAGKISEFAAAECIIMWEFDLERKMWEELGKMPSELFERLIVDRQRNWFECFAVGNRICFRARRSLNILVYQLCEKSWSWLPSCPFSREISADACLRVKGVGLQPQISGDLLSNYSEVSSKFPRPLLIQSPSSAKAVGNRICFVPEELTYSYVPTVCEIMELAYDLPIFSSSAGLRSAHFLER